MMRLDRFSNAELLAATRELVQRQTLLEADLVAHLIEIDSRKLYLEHAAPSLFVFCTDELGFTEDVASTRITVARLAPRPDVPSMIRRLPVQATLAGPAAQVMRPGAIAAMRAGAIAAPPPARRAVVTPLAEETFKVQFTAKRALRDKLRAAQDLLRHRVPDGDLAAIVDAALDLLIAQVKKERFAAGCKPRQRAAPQPSSRSSESAASRSSDLATSPSSQPATSRASQPPASRHVPSAIRREVYERDGGRCTFTDASGKRCPATGGLEIDHIDGYARTHEHDPSRMRLLCRAHNQHAADQMYGLEFMQRKRSIRPGTDRRDELTSEPHPEEVPMS